MSAPCLGVLSELGCPMSPMKPFVKRLAFWPLGVFAVLILSFGQFACNRTAADLSKTPEPTEAVSLPASDGPQAIVLAGGCFWCTEGVFEQLEGVIDVESGYAGGTADTANYQAVSQGSTGHAEVIRITYDPAKVDFAKLLEIFFTIAHDPTQLNRQGADVGTQYRSAVFYADEAQRDAVAAYIQQLEAAGVYEKPIVTTLEPLEAYYPAEAYHQDFVQQNPTHPYIRQQALPKIEKLEQYHADDLRQ